MPVRLEYPATDGKAYDPEAYATALPWTAVVSGEMAPNGSLHVDMADLEREVKAGIARAVSAAANAQSANDARSRILDAARIAARYGSIDGAHHKEWVIDQMLRALLGPDGYAKWLTDVNVDGYAPWSEGIAP